MAARGDDRRAAIARATVAAAIATMVIIASWPTSRLVGVDFVIAHDTLPLWKKASEFIDRDAQLRQLSRAVLAGSISEAARAEAALDWTRAHVRHAPDGLPVIDDHIASIVQRGYGQADQQADVFTTLLVYAGVPAYWQVIGARPRFIPLSYVLIEGQWRVFDVTRGLTFRTASGTLATPADIAADSGLVERVARQAGVDQIDDYLWYFGGYRPPQPPEILRAELQMPRRRLSFEIGKLIGATRSTWTQPRGEERQR
jgi:hypothetical protein